MIFACGSTLRELSVTSTLHKTFAVAFPFAVLIVRGDGHFTKTGGSESRDLKET